MANPIVIDCGGSTRVKQILAAGGFGNMPTLLDVHDLNAAVGGAVMPGTGPLPPGAVGSQHRANGPFGNMSVVFQDANGIPFLVPVAFPNSFVISSNLGQNVRGDFVPRLGGGSDLILTIFSTVSDPLVEAKQHRTDNPPRKGRRRYVVSNAGPIKTVIVNDALPAVFDATNDAIPPVAPGAVGPGAAAPAPAAGAPLYVTVVAS